MPPLTYSIKCRNVPFTICADPKMTHYPNHTCHENRQVLLWSWSHMNEGNTGKIYFLSGRGRRSTARMPLRKKSEPVGSSSGERRKPSPQETVWLARALFIEGMYFALLWLAEGTDLFSFQPETGLRQWLYSFFPAEIFVAVIAVFGAYELQR